MDDKVSSLNLQHPNQRTTGFYYLQVAIILGLCIAVFFLLVFVNEKRMLPSGIAPLQNFDIAQVPKEATPPFGNASFSRLPNEKHLYVLGPAQTDIVLRQKFDATKNGIAHEGLYINRARDEVKVYLNGERIGTESSEQSEIAISNFGPRYVSFPSRLIQKTDNTLDIVFYGLQARPHLHDAFIGPRPVLEKAFLWRHFITSDLINVMNGIGLFVAVFCFSVATISKLQRLEYFYMAAIMIFWVARNIYYFFPFYAWPLAYQSIFFTLSTFGMVASIASLANAWSDGSSKNYIYFALVGLGYPIVTFLLDLIDPRIGNAIYLYLGLPLIILTIAWVGMRTFKHFRGKRFSVSVLIGFGFCAGAGLIDILGQLQLSGKSLNWMPHATVPYLPLATVVVALGMIYALVRRTVDLQVIEANQSAILARELKAREEELDIVYAQRRAQERAHVVAQERQRLMQDMHDGIGSQLLALQFKITRDDLGKEALSKEVQKSLDDLRLIVDSLDTETDDIGPALGGFRGRIQPQLNAAGVDLEWKMDVSPDIEGFGPQAILHIYRIMQEIIANALRHSGMTKLKMLFWDEVVEGAQYLKITITDNGRGLPDEFIAGKGLANMERRAKSLGGTLMRHNLTPGLETKLIIPVPPI